MRLLEVTGDGELRLTSDLTANIPPYAILSHTWGSEHDEVLFEDMKAGTAFQRSGYQKIQFCSRRAVADGLSHFWVDTCCIDQSNSTELSEAINSMFRWYHNAAKCYVYLSDVAVDQPTTDESLEPWEVDFRKCRWLSRGWTLQELLAPSSVEFFSHEGKRLGDKRSLEQPLRELTGIAVEALRGRPLSEFSVLERMAWSEKRQTKREEDKAYSLFGIFGIHLPLIYGEGSSNALTRLREEISKRTGDLSNTSNTRVKSTAHFIVPLGRNAGFVGREPVLEWLSAKIPPRANKDDCQRTAVEGLGGVGKTQIALQAAYRLREEHPDSSVFWVPAVTMATFETAYRKIGEALGIDGIEDEETDPKDIVKAALEKPSAGSWLLIIDNADDVDLLCGYTNGAAICDYLPFNQKGSILFTTRNHEAPVQLDIAYDDVYRIGEMTQSEALAMMHKVLKPSQLRDVASTNTLLDCLAHLPLAIKQASAYMTRTGMTTTKYLASYLHSDKQQIDLLSRKFEDRGRYREINNPIATTWLISFDYLVQEHPLAVQYLKYICYLGEKDIPKSLLPPGDSEIDEEEAISVLFGYSFIMQREDTEFFDIHRLVRLATRNWISQDERIQQITYVVQQMSKIYPDPFYNNRDVWFKYMPHAQEVLDTCQDCTDEDAFCDLAFNFGESYSLLGNYRKAEKWLRLACDSMKRRLGEDDYATLRGLDYLGIVLRRDGKYDEASEIYTRALELKKETLGLEHYATIGTMDNLAVVLFNQEKYEEAAAMHQEALDLYMKVLGLEDAETLACMDNLAIALGQQKKYEESEQMHRQVLELTVKVLGADHPDSLSSMNNHACALEKLDRVDEAEELYRRAIEMKEKVLGREHPDTANSIDNLASLLRREGKYDEAEPMHREALAFYQKALGQDHPTTQMCVENLEECLELMGKLDIEDEAHSDQ